MAFDPFSFIAGIFKPAAELVDSLHTSKEEKAAMALALLTAQQEAAAKMAGMKRDVIVAEANSKHFLTANWRPITMLCFVFMIMWNFIVAPLGSFFSAMFGGPILPVLDLPPGLWATLDIGIGGYIGMRTLEKVKGVS